MRERGRGKGQRARGESGRAGERGEAVEGGRDEEGKRQKGRGERRVRI